MALLLTGLPRIQIFIPGTQQVASGYKIYSYFGSISTNPGQLNNTYPNINNAVNLVNPNTNPVVLDPNGMADIVVVGSTKLVLTNPSGDLLNPLWTVDNIGLTSNNIVDGNGNPLLNFTSVNNAQNWVTITNSTTGNPPVVSSAGNDTNVSLSLATKGTGTINLTSGVITSGSFTFGSPPAGVLPPGFAGQFYGTAVPSGWLECDGSAISRVVYAPLFAAIGTTWGAGDGSTTFNIPNLQRSILMGRGGSGTATIGNTVGSIGGEENHLLIVNEIPGHTHSYSPSTFASQYGVGAVSAGNALGSTVTGSTGGGAVHNNIQPSVIVIQCIKL